MDISLRFNLNSKLYLRDPEETELGRKILQHSILLIHKIGFEEFTFKKLAKEIHTTEAGIYRYFENKHKLLVYLFDWYWSWQLYRLSIHTKHLKKPEAKIRQAIRFLSLELKDDIAAAHINKTMLSEIVMAEGAKAYLTKHVTEYNKVKLFKPYKDLCAVIASFIKEYNPRYKYCRSLASTVIEMAHSQKYYSKNLPSLTDFNSDEEQKISAFLEDLVFAGIQPR
jgi:AcrR family transcriptional regulator